MSAKEKIETYINLDSYSSSEGWVGFVEKSGCHTTKLCIQAVDEFFNYFSEDLKNAQSIFSLSYWSTTEALLKDYEVGDCGSEIIKELQKLGWFKSETEQNQNFTMIDFDSYNKSDIYNLLLSIMVVGDTMGSVFVILPDRNLILYTHEDIGFGVISTDSSDYEAISFLSHMSKNSEFSSYKNLLSADNKM